MFNPIILQKLKELDIHTITQAVKKAQQEENLLNITIRVEPPYFFYETSSINSARKQLYKPYIIGYIAVNGTAYLIVYVKDKDIQEDVKRKYESKLHDNIFLDLYQHIEIKHKKKPGKSTSDKTITFDTFETSSILDELQEASNELPNTYYPQKHPYIYNFFKQLNYSIYLTIILKQASNVWAQAISLPQSFK